MGQIDILACHIADFTVDNTVDSVAAAFNLNDFINASGNGDFQPRDNIIIQSAQITLPYCFSVAEREINITIDWEDTAANSGAIPELGAAGIYLPIENVEYDLNIYVPWPNPNDNNTHLRGGGGLLNISMFNVPDDLNGDTLRIYAYLKVLSNLGPV